MYRGPFARVLRSKAMDGRRAAEQHRASQNHGQAVVQNVGVPSSPHLEFSHDTLKARCKAATPTVSLCASSTLLADLCVVIALLILAAHGSQSVAALV